MVQKQVTALTQGSQCRHNVSLGRQRARLRSFVSSRQKGSFEMH